MPKRIMIIDDDNELCLALREMLESEGYEIQTAGDIGRADKVIQHTAFDMVLLDLKLPGDSLAFLKRMKSKDPEHKILIISASRLVEMNETQTINKEEKHNINILKLANGIVRKPFDPENLIQMIKQMIYD
ncbi:MAG: response regulator [bacterium]